MSDNLVNNAWSLAIEVDRLNAALSEARSEIERLRESAKGQLVIVQQAIAERKQAESDLSTLRARVREVVGPFAKGYWSKQNPTVKVSVIFNHNPYDERAFCTVGDIAAARQLMEEVK